MRSSSPGIYNLVGKQTPALTTNKIRQKLFNLRQTVCNIYKENVMRILREELGSFFQHSKELHASMAINVQAGFIGDMILWERTGLDEMGEKGMSKDGKSSGSKSLGWPEKV